MAKRFTFRRGRLRQAFQFVDISGQRVAITRRGCCLVLCLGEAEVVLYSNMQGFSPFLEAAYLAWCQAKQLDPQAQDFHNPADYRWFPDQAGERETMTMPHIPQGGTGCLTILPFPQALAQALAPGQDYDESRWLYVPNVYGEYRYILGTRGSRPLICMGINPSTAAPGALDNTLKSVERIALGNGFDSFLMFNVYAQRATDPTPWKTPAIWRCTGKIWQLFATCCPSARSRRCGRLGGRY